MRSSHRADLFEDAYDVAKLLSPHAPQLALFAELAEWATVRHLLTPRASPHPHLVRIVHRRPTFTGVLGAGAR